MAGDQLFSWFDAAGTEWPLNGEGAYLVEEGVVGLFGMPPMVNTEAKTPLRDGSVLRFTLAGVRVVDLPFKIQASDYGQLYAARRAILSALNPKRGPGMLRSTAPDGVQRDLICVYDSGLEIDGKKSFGDHEEAILVFRAQDPYLYDTLATMQTYFASGAGAFFPILPILLGSSSVLSSFSIDNQGDASAYPVFVIQGPGSAITLINNSTGRVIDLTGNGGLTLGGSDVLTIDVRAGTVTLQDGTSKYDRLTFDSSLWTLAQGYNNISASITGTNSSSYLQVQYKQRWLGV